MSKRNAPRRHAPTEAQLGRAFRALSQEHLATRRRDDPGLLWGKIERRLGPNFSVHARRPARVPWRTLLAAAAAIGFGALLVWFAGRQEATLHYRIVGTETTLDLDAQSSRSSRLLATEASSTQVFFSDTSEVTLFPHTTLRLEVQKEGRVLARLTQGKLSVRVHHRDSTDYRFLAGPYEVQVVGTAFDLDYDPDSEHLHLAMHEGRVLVRDASGTLQAVTAGQTLERPESKGPPPSGQTSSAPEDPISPQEASTHLSQRNPTHRSAAPARSEPSAPNFRDLARRGQFAEIVAFAEREGVERILRERSPEDLQELAQAARYTGRMALAERTFGHLERVFPTSAPGTTASFFVGRMAEERGLFGEALGRYTTYLAASPEGLYSAEALGRKMALIQKTQGKTAALSSAREYLKRFPKGPYRTLAEGILGSKRSD